MYLSSISSSLFLYDVNTWDLKKVYGNHDGVLRDISWSDDGKYLLQVNAKGMVEILSSADPEIKTLQHIPLKETWSASFHREGHRNVAVGTTTGNVMIWDTKNKIITKTFPAPSQQSSVSFLSFNSRNTNLAATMQNGDTILYSLVTNIPILTVKLSCSKSISAMKFHHDCRFILGLATDEGHMVLRDVTVNKDKAFFENAHAAPISDFAYSLVNRDVLLSSGYDKIMQVYDIRLHNIVSTIRTSHILTSLAINTENQVALGTKSKQVLVYDLRDLTSPYKILKGHNEEVKKVAFQPHRKKAHSVEISLREDSEIKMSPMNIHSSVQNNSDAFLVMETPPHNGTNVCESKSEREEDSFLVMLDLDKSDIEQTEDQCFKSPNFETNVDKYDTRYKQLDAEKKITKSSTPQNNRLMENFLFPSPIVNTEQCLSKVNDDLTNSKTTSRPVKDLIDNSVIDELKEFLKLNLSNISDDNRDQYLNVMMLLTKQNIFLEKRLNNMNEQLQTLINNQSVLLDMNRKLILEIDGLKSIKSIF